MGINSLNSINQKSATENVASLLREAVLDGRLKPGEKLREKELCEELGVSRTPLREAFRILQVERLLVHEPYIGVKVAHFSKKFLKETWEIRKVLESYAAGQCVVNFTEADRCEYQEILDKMENISLDDLVEFEKADENLHMLIAQKSGNMELEQMIINLWQTTTFLRKVALYKSHTRVASSKAEHISILSSILSGNEKLAIDLMRKHFINSENDVELSEFFSGGLSGG